MIEYINDNPLKMIVFFILLSRGNIYLSIKLRQLKIVFFIFVFFYMPLFFKSAVGCLAIHMAIILCLLSLIFHSQEKKIGYSFINLDDTALFFNDRGRLILFVKY